MIDEDDEAYEGDSPVTVPPSSESGDDSVTLLEDYQGMPTEEEKAPTAFGEYSS